MLSKMCELDLPSVHLLGLLDGLLLRTFTNITENTISQQYVVLNTEMSRIKFSVFIFWNLSSESTVDSQ